MEDRDCIFNCSLRSDTLDRLYNNLLGLFASSKARFVHCVIDICHGSRFSFITERVHQLLFGFFSRKTRNLLQLLLRFLLESFDFLCFVFDSFLLVFNLLTLHIQLVLSTLHFTLLLIELLLTLLLTLLLLMELLLSLAYLVFVLKFKSNKFLFCFDDFVFLNYFSFFSCFAKNSFAMISEYKEAKQRSK